MRARRSRQDRRCADGERGGAGSVSIMAWAVWLAVPFAATALASLWAWWRARPKRAPTAEQAVRAHRDYLDALVVPTRGTARVAPGTALPEPAGVHD